MRAVVRQPKLIALQDRSAAVLIELPALYVAIHAGDRISVEGENCSLRQSRFYTQLGTMPVVDNDGRHEDEAHGYRPWRRCDGRGVLHNCLSKEIVGYCLRVQR